MSRPLGNSVDGVLTNNTIGPQPTQSQYYGNINDNDNNDGNNNNADNNNADNSENDNDTLTCNPANSQLVLARSAQNLNSNATDLVLYKDITTANPITDEPFDDGHMANDAEEGHYTFATAMQYMERLHTQQRLCLERARVALQEQERHLQNVRLILARKRPITCHIERSFFDQPFLKEPLFPRKIHDEPLLQSQLINQEKLIPETQEVSQHFSKTGQCSSGATTSDAGS